VHNGHLVAALTVRTVLGLERVLMVLAPDPWQKMDRELAPVEDRLAMLHAAVDGVDGLEVSRLELDRPGPTYTADTVEELSSRSPTPELFLIVGADVAAELATWDRTDVIRDLATVAIVSRADVDEPAAPGPGWRVHHVRMPALEISSTDLRRRAAVGEPLDGLMPPESVRCLRERGLYPGPE
jgi:nicotinate-nucleotide adenylyltransferase